MKHMGVNFIFKHNKENYNPQIIFTKENKKASIWCPGRKDAIPISFKPALTGYTGRTYKNIYKSWYGQDCFQCCSFIDIDYKDNKIYSVNEFHNKILKLLPDENIRTSSSGQGIHIILIYKEPIHFEKGWENPAFSALTKNIALPVVTILEKNNIIVDKSTATVYYLEGKEQKWLQVTDKEYEVNKEDIKEDMKKIYHNANIIEIDKFNYKIRDLIKILHDNHFIQVMNGKIFTKYNFCTKYLIPILEKHTNQKIFTNSAMKNDDNNCYMVFTEKQVVLFVNADKGIPCFKILNI